MDCRIFSLNAGPMSWRHRLQCTACRRAYTADKIIARDLLRLKAEGVPADGLKQTLTAVGLTTEGGSVRSRRKLPTYRRLALPGGSVSAAVMVATFAWLHYTETNPRVTVTYPKMPVLNAFDSFGRAAKLMRDEGTIDYAQTGLYPSANRANVKKVERTVMTAAGMSGIKATPVSIHNGQVVQVPADPSGHYTLAEKEALIRENAPALRELREGLTWTYLAPPIRSYTTTLPYYARDRAMARLLSLDAQTKRERGDWPAAVNSSLDAMQLGVMIPHGAPVIGKLVGIACEAIGRKPLWGAIDKLDARHAELAARRLEALEASTVPLWDTLTEEKWLGQAGMIEAFRQPDWRRLFSEMSGTNNTPTTDMEYIFRPTEFLGEAAHLRAYLYSKRRIFADYTRIMDMQIANARRPGSPPSLIEADSFDPYLAQLIPVFSELSDQELGGNKVQNGLLKTAFALRAYRQEHHGYPGTLAALVPDYLQRLPMDPYAEHSAFRYRRNRASYVLYSIGPDRKDDGGVPAYRPGEQGHEYHVTRNSIGDIVAGVNTN